MSEVVQTTCGRCGGAGRLNALGTAEDSIICPTCGGSGETERSVSELPLDYCPWCDSVKRMVDGECVDCMDGDADD